MENNDNLYDLFTRYLNDKCSAEEIRQLLEYFNADENGDILRYLIQNEVDQNKTSNLSEQKVDAATNAVKRALIRDIRDQKSNHNKAGHWYLWIRFAAVALVVTLPALVAIRSWTKITDRFVSVKMDIVKTEKGERKMILLGDGTKVWLAPLGVFNYPEQFKGDLREVKLIGEAFFEVAKDKHHPFIIHTENMDTRVVGTSFLIRAPQNFEQADVTVVTGVVKVSALNTIEGMRKSVILKPKQRAVFNNKTDSLMSIDFPDAAMMLKRKEGILIFHDSPVSQVITDLSRYYNVKISLQNKSSKCLCSGEFDTNKSLDIALEQLGAAIGAKVLQIKGSYQIKGGCE